MSRLANLSETNANRIVNLHIGILWYNFNMQKRKSRFKQAAFIRFASEEVWFPWSRWNSTSETQIKNVLQKNT